MEDNNKQAILKTVAYADLFQFPLTTKELWRYLIIESSVSLGEVTQLVKELKQYLVVRHGYITFRSRAVLIAQRQERKKESKKKLRQARRISRLLGLAPSVALIGVSGSVSMQNASADDDIDLFIVTQPQTLFITRFILLGMLHVLGLRRSYGETSAKNKICINMWLDTTALSMPENRRDLYTAHEVAQLVPIFERGTTYKEFLRSNSWIQRYLPNSLKDRYKGAKVQRYRDNRVLVRLFKVCEPLAKKLQLVSINKHKTTETVADHVLAFHPYDYREHIETALKKKLRMLQRGIEAKYSSSSLTNV